MLFQSSEKFNFFTTSSQRTRSSSTNCFVSASPRGFSGANPALVSDARKA